MNSTDKNCKPSNDWHQTNWNFFSSNFDSDPQEDWKLEEMSNDNARTTESNDVTISASFDPFLEKEGLKRSLLSSLISKDPIYLRNKTIIVSNKSSITLKGFISSLQEKTTSARPKKAQCMTPEEIQADLLKKIVDLSEINQKSKKIFSYIKQFIEEDNELYSKFHKCQEQAKEILLMPPKKDDSEPVGHLIVEKWRMEMQNASYFESMKTRFSDFLEKNPDFCALFSVKYQAAKHEDIEHQEWMEFVFRKMQLLKYSSANSIEIIEAAEIVDKIEAGPEVIKRMLKSLLPS